MRHDARRTRRGLAWILAGCAALVCVAWSGCGNTSGGSGIGGNGTGGGPAPPPTPADWTRFGWDAGRSSAPAIETGITATNVASLTRQQVTLDGTVDASAIYLHGAQVRGAAHDVFFVTTTYGKTIAIDADSGSVLWEYTPSSYASLKGTYRITTATPVADPDRQSIYAASPDGVIQKLAVADGHVEWATSITKLP
ncbi:MAG TPA: PQQ-binding-like beta-propeller repeat protein, partial [Gemmatimonadales bacterium]|nr:PQQ-binding-like beta-propeller repeat protein [Gemmatimonadales bacterium]